MAGNPKSMCEFGTMYMKEGYWIVQSDEDALEWWLKSAEIDIYTLPHTSNEIWTLAKFKLTYNSSNLNKIFALNISLYR